MRNKLPSWAISDLFPYTFEANTCCGVLELGDIEHGLYVFYLESEDKRATQAQVNAAYREWEKERAIMYGMGVAYMLPDQHKGTVGKLFRANGWKQPAKFLNPKTDRTLFLYYKVFNKPKRIKPKKSIFSRRR